jgi:type IV pilus biogenesis protein CpaD/CtpE
MTVTRIKTGGRKAGTPNRNSSDIRALALTHSSAAVEVLASLMATSTNDAVRLSAARELLDRSCGKAVDHAKIRIFETYDAAPALDPSWDPFA